MSESKFMAEIIEEAKRLGYRVYHDYDSRKSEEGFPDLIMVAPKIKIMFAVEVKDTGKKPTDAQAEWLDRLDNSHVVAECWKPKDKPRAFSLLQRYGEEPWQEVVARYYPQERYTTEEFRKLRQDGRI